MSDKWNVIFKELKSNNYSDVQSSDNTSEDCIVKAYTNNNRITEIVYDGSIDAIREEASTLSCKGSHTAARTSKAFFVR